MKASPPVEAQKCQFFKASMKAEEPRGHTPNETEDEMIRRFLVARKWDVGKALDMYRKCNQWRASTFPLPAQAAQYYLTRCGNDKANRPCLLWWGSRYGDPKTQGGVTSTSTQVVRVLEQTLASIEPASPDKRFTFLLYFDQGSVFDVQLVKQISSILMNNYPERLAKAIIFPGTRLATSLWAICRNFLDSETREKVVIIPESNPKGFLDLIPKESLPTIFGGDFVVESKEAARVAAFTPASEVTRWI